MKGGHVSGWREERTKIWIIVWITILPLIHLPRCATSTIFKQHSFLHSTSIFQHLFHEALRKQIRTLEVGQSLLLILEIKYKKCRKGLFWISYVHARLPFTSFKFPFHSQVGAQEPGLMFWVSAPALFKVEVPRGWLAWDTAASLKVEGVTETSG